MERLQTSLERIKGVGPKVAEQLAVAGLVNIGDLVYFLPRKHQDFTEVVRIADLAPGAVSVRGKVESVTTRRVRRGMSVTEAALRDDSGAVKVVWFNQPYRAAQLEKDKIWMMSGEFAFGRGKYQITNPNVEDASQQAIQGARLLPIYREIKGIKSALLRKLLAELRPLITMLPETLPSEVIQKYQLISHADAVLGMHFPESSEQVKAARDRLGFEELYALLMAALLNKESHSSLEGWNISFDEKAAKEFVATLPFQLTPSQKVAVWEAVQGFASSRPMNRLLQGDVGAGKTVVAGMAAFLAAKQGYQTALMAPTELLAAQHAETLRSLLDSKGVEVALLTGSVKAKDRKPLYAHIEDGTVDIVVGTHALFQDAVKFSRLGFVVIDEQHRFGVAQRQALLDKSAKMPHLLAMTATPIPRSLQLTVYGELDISLLRERPKGRKPIATKIISPNSRDAMYHLIDEQIEDGRQAYVICPLIAEGKDSELKSAEAEMIRLRSSIFRHRRIGLLHGQLRPESKLEVMKAFSEGEIDILVSTTVVEVGVDVPNATAMIIEGADRFGLAQLHQLRGRVGRSDHQSYCYLVPSTSKLPTQRLRELERSNDGFYLAEKDLELRGPGEIYGRAQHGALNLAVANITDTVLLKKVRDAAEWSIKNGVNVVQYTKLASEIARYQRLTTLN